MRRMVKETDLDQITVHCYRIEFDILKDSSTNQLSARNLHQEILYYTNREIDSIDALKADFLEKGFTIEHPLNPHIVLYIPCYSQTNLYIITGIYIDGDQFKYMYSIEPADTIRTNDPSHPPSSNVITPSLHPIF